MWRATGTPNGPCQKHALLHFTVRHEINASFSGAINLSLYILYYIDTYYHIDTILYFVLCDIDTVHMYIKEILTT